ncbi:MAG: methyltransferase domain-containing protein [Planctomycetaceae bacterium]
MTTRPQPRFVAQDKYRTVGRYLRHRSGSLLDVGARDRVLLDHLDAGSIDYLSADLGPDHDLQLDLESKLDVPDRQFDFVVALDVLEHVEHIHAAFHELARITRHGLIVALPNMASLRRRLSFLGSAWLGTGKYNLDCAPPGDRHRWLTTYDEMNAFVFENAQRTEMTIREHVNEIEVGYRSHRWQSALVWGLSRAGFADHSLFTGRCLYFLERAAQHEHETATSCVC